MRFRQLAFLILLAAPLPASAQEFFLKKGDVVVVMGDSITEQRLYCNYLEIWSQTRFPSYNLVFRNVGIGGDTSGGGNGRFKRDVLPFKPTVLTVDFGMNDGGYIARSQRRKGLFDPYMKGLQGIADQAKAANIRVAWITPQPVEHNPGTPRNRTTRRWKNSPTGVGEIAKKNDGLFAISFIPTGQSSRRPAKPAKKAASPAATRSTPGPPGQALMAASILKGMHFPKQVSSVELFIADAQRPPRQLQGQLRWPSPATARKS